MLLFTFGVFLFHQISRQHFAGRPNDHLAIAAVISITITGILTLLYAMTYKLESTAFFLLQPLVALDFVAGTAFIFSLHRFAEWKGYDRKYYAPGAVSLILASVGLMWVVSPTGIGLPKLLLVRIYSFDYLATQTAGAVAKIQPATGKTTLRAFCLVVFTALAGALLSANRVRTQNRLVELFILL